MPARPTYIAPALAATLLAGGCAQISVTDQDIPAPAPSVDINASAISGLLSHIPGSVTVASASLRHGQTSVPPPSFASAGAHGTTVTYRFTASPDFLNGDVLSVTWSADAVALSGAHYTVQKTATYSFHGRVGK
jgi:hypothetical protein